ncbi:MAG: condensation domain-containing protein, partial [Clostridiales Family XIII bacterium]|nr:condensation domain-containing protein [Clostridiales Family XIII bacterium]
AAASGADTDQRSAASGADTDQRSAASGADTDQRSAASDADTDQRSAASGADTDPSNLREALRLELPDYMLPAYIMKIPSLPFTSNGKLDKRALPKPEGASGKAYAAPVTENEKMVVEVFEEILRKSPIGIDDNFFEIGGDSIKAIRMAAKLRENGYEIAVKDIMQLKSPRLISGTIERGVLTDNYEQDEVNGESPLSPMQRAFLNMQYKNAGGFSRMVTLYSKDGFEAAHLKAAIRKIVEHHDALRNVFGREHQNTISVRESALYKWLECDCSGKTDPLGMIEQIHNEIYSGIDIEKGPLVSAGLIRTDEGEQFAICIHRLVADNISWKIIMDDLSDAYRQSKEFGVISLPMKTASYKEWTMSISASSLETAAHVSGTPEDSAAHVSGTPEDSAAHVGIAPEHTAAHVGGASKHSVEVDEAVKQLLCEAAQASAMKPEHLLLAALGAALKRNRKPFAMPFVETEIEYDSRIDAYGAASKTGYNADSGILTLSRTVGCFSGTIPMMIEAKDPADSILAVRMELGRIGAGISSYKEPVFRWKLPKNGEMAKIKFSFSPGMDDEIQKFEGAKLLAVRDIKAIPGNAAANSPIELDTRIEKGRLVIDAAYNKTQYKSEEIDVFLENYRNAIAEVSRVCYDMGKAENERISEHVLRLLDNYGNNYAQCDLKAAYEAMFMQREFLKLSNDIMVTATMLDGTTAKKTAAVIRKITASQGALRTRYNSAAKRFEEYAYADNWDVPVIDIAKSRYDINMLIRKYSEIISEKNFISEGGLLSRIIVLDIGGKRNVVLHAVHHCIWDKMSSDLFENTLRQLISDGKSTIDGHSYAEYCRAIQMRKESYKLSEAEALKLAAYSEIARRVGEGGNAVSIGAVSIIKTNLTETAYKRFAERPLDTAMEFMSRLIYEQSDAPALELPYWLMFHNRNDNNRDIMGLMLDVMPVTYNTHTKEMKALGIAGTSDAREIPVAEKLDIWQGLHPGENAFDIVPGINYTGIYASGAGGEAQTAPPTSDTNGGIVSNQVKTLSSGEAHMLSMTFSINGNALEAGVVGLALDTDKVNRALVYKTPLGKTFRQNSRNVRIALIQSR